MAFLETLLSYLPARSAATKQVFYGVLAGLALSLTTASTVQYYNRKKRKNLPPSFESRPIELRSDEVVNGVIGLIGELNEPDASAAAEFICMSGNTPLVRINSLSNALGVEILGKAEVRIFARILQLSPCNYLDASMPVPQPRGQC